MVSYEMLNEKTSGVFPGFQVKFREASGGPSSGVHVGGTRFGPLFEIYVLSFVLSDLVPTTIAAITQ
jgi:hypothetical protein